MIMDLEIRCSRESRRSSAVNPTQAKTGLEWGTQHLLPVERERQVCEKSRLAGEADYDLGAGGHHASRRGNLLARDSAAYNLQRQTGRAG
jgi:hypothetical protein